MINRLRGLFQRYARTHRHVAVPGFALKPSGHVDRVVLDGSQVTFVGWSTADRITLAGADGQSATRPGIPRQDVAEATGHDPRVGFEISQTYGDGCFVLVTESGGQAERHEIAPIPAGQLRRNRIRLALYLGAALVRLTPQIVALALTGSPAARARIKAGLGLQDRPEAGPMNAGLFADPTVSVLVPAPVPVTLILPVYNAFDLLDEVLDRVRQHTDLPWRMVVIEDCSTDARVRPWLRDWVTADNADHPGRVELIENETNRGFIGSVNAGLARAAGIGAHVVLLNSDALVPAGWASRLIRPLLTEPDAASVTPMSNDAEILSVPALCRRTVLKPGQGDAIDALARRINPDAGRAEIPTGVGFCMAMHIDYLRKIPELDPVFGRGYGEEVDWCQKARARGGRHLALAGLFVEHRGGESFGSEDKLKLVLRNNRIVAARYPGYDAEVQDFIAADPLVTARVALAVAWAAGRTDGAVPVYLAHVMGGGADKYLDGRIAADLETRGCPAVVLRVGGGTRWQVEVISEAGRVGGTTDDFAFVERLLDPLESRHIVYSCAVGDADPVTLPDHLLALKRGAGDTLEVLVHDYFMLSPSYTLLDNDGIYRGPVEETRSDPAHTVRRPDGTLVSLPDWRAAWGRLMREARDIVVFSEDSRAHVLAAYPELDDRIALRPHDLLAEVPRIPRPATEKRVIGVLGNIGYQKGAALVADLGQLLERDPATDIVVIGNVDPAYMPSASVIVHGDYRIENLSGLVARYGITDWLIPSIWPETFSYTTHECLATGLPTFAFDIGAQGAAVARGENGRPIPFAADGNLAQIVYDALEAGGPEGTLAMKS